MEQLQRIALVDLYPAGKVLYSEGQPVKGAYILCNGRAKISVTSGNGDILILRVALPGEAVGLDAALMNRPYRETAELLDSCQVRFISRERLASYFLSNAQAALKAALQMNLNYDAAQEQIRSLVFSGSATQKLAQLLMLWAPPPNCGRTEPSFTVPYTHEEIAQMIGSRRETVTRVFTKFKQNNAIEVHHRTFIVKDFKQLAHLAGQTGIPVR